MLIRMILAAALMIMAPMAMAEGGATVTAGGGASRYYQIATPEMVLRSDLPYHNPVPALSFAIDTPGTVKAIHIIPTAEILGSVEDMVLGSVWVNASAGPTIDDLFAIQNHVPPMVLHKLADVGMPQTYDMPVASGDVVTVLLSDGQTGAPPLPPATWVLEVQE